MTQETKPETNPFTKRLKTRLSRRAFSKGVMTAGIAIASVPLMPNVLKASPVAGLPTRMSLRDVISEQLLALDGKASLVNAAQDEAFHFRLSRQLLDQHPANLG